MNEKKCRGGPPKGSRNAQKTQPWLNFDLETPEGLAAFLRELTKQVYTGGIGTRTGESITRILGLLKEVTLSEEIDRRLDALEEKDKQSKREEKVVR
jgi:hypothetical protein